jgi:hypothetical protein
MTIETLTKEEQRALAFRSDMTAGAKALRIIDAQAARIAELEGALLAIKQAYEAATYTHGGDLRGLDEAAIDTALEVAAARHPNGEALAKLYGVDTIEAAREVHARVDREVAKTPLRVFGGDGFPDVEEES